MRLRSRGFLEELEKAMSVDANAAAGLEVEVTESTIMEDIKRSIDTLTAIRRLGVTITIDDFGTAFSSLSYLSGLPADTLKIDRSLTAGVPSTFPDGSSSCQRMAPIPSIRALCDSVRTRRPAATPTRTPRYPAQQLLPLLVDRGL